MNSPLLGLDLGFKRTGVALSEGGLLAQPLAVIEATPPHMTKVVKEVLTYVERYAIKTVVIGVPYTENEEGTEQAQKIEQVITQLEQALQDHHLVVELIRLNEYYSTQDAHHLYPKADKDSAAASLILQDYLDSNVI